MKSPLKSKTILSNVVSLVAAVVIILKMVGIEVDPETEAEVVRQIDAAAMGGFAVFIAGTNLFSIWSRWTATEKISASQKLTSRLPGDELK